MANTSAIWQQAAYTTYQLSSPSCSTRTIQKSLSPYEDVESFVGKKAVCVCVCECVYVCVCMHEGWWVCVCVCVCVYAFEWLQVCVCACTWVTASVCVHAREWLRVCVCMHAFMHMCPHACIRQNWMHGHFNLSSTNRLPDLSCQRKKIKKIHHDEISVWFFSAGAQLFFLLFF